MENKFCMSCGQQLDAGAKFCPYCGATQPTEAPNTQAQGGNQPVGQPQQPQTPPVQPNPNTQQGYQQVPQQPGMQYQQQGQYQQYPQQPGMQYQQPVQKPSFTLKQLKNQVPGQTGPQPELNFIDSLKYTMANIVDFKTPESRKSVYWWNTLAISVFNIIVWIIISMIVSVTEYSFFYTSYDMMGDLLYILLSLINIPLLLSNLSAAIRRIIYLGENPWLVLVPGYNIYLLVTDKKTYYQQPYQQNYGQQQVPQQPMQNQQQPLQPQQVPTKKQTNDQN
ncbi:MAG: zinc ribbon domain-containing protein [Ligilactobacillus murinus]|nr:zinc ribbon domain-containing protein [Ligilactobacillus murinus]